MTDIQLELEVIKDMADGHRAAAEDLEGVLRSMPASVDGGIASQLIASIVARIATRAGELTTASRVVGELLDEVASGVRRTDEAAAEGFQAALSALEDDR